jgi:hypothetical protein
MKSVRPASKHRAVRAGTMRGGMPHASKGARCVTLALSPPCAAAVEDDKRARIWE